MFDFEFENTHFLKIDIYIYNYIDFSNHFCNALRMLSTMTIATLLRQAEEIFVHTLNTESGLMRKVDALGVGNWACLLESEPAASTATRPKMLDLTKLGFTK